MHFQDVSDETLPAVIRPRTLPRRGIVLHETIGYDSRAYLQGGSLADQRRVSADYLISRVGNVWQLTPPGWYAFHTGVARWQGYQEIDRSLNQSMIGIELENMPQDGQVITTEQYIALAWLIRRLIGAHYLPFDWITEHASVALPVGRKTDPMTLNWAILSQEIIHPSIQQSLFEVKGELS